MSTPTIIVCVILLTFIILGFVLKKKKCTTDTCEDSRVEGISRAQMNLDPKWNKGCVRDRKNGKIPKKIIHIKYEESRTYLHNGGKR